MNLRILLTGLAFLWACTSFAVETVIRGEAPTYPSESVKVLRYQDLVTYKLVEVATVPIDAAGNFSFSVSIDEVEYYTLRIGKVNASMFAVPGTTYQVVFPALDAKQAATMANTARVDLAFVDLDLTADVNGLVTDFNNCYMQFFADNSVQLARGRNREIAEVFRDDANDWFAAVNSDYFAAYKKFAIGGVEQLTKGVLKPDERMEMYNYYLKDVPVLYRNSEYMNFVANFYSNYLATYVSQNGNKIIQYAIDTRLSYTILDEAFRKDETLVNPQLRELVMIRSLGEEFHNGKYNKKNLISLLDSVATQSDFEENRMIAQNVAKEVTKLQVGYNAPDFKLIGPEELPVSLGDFKGKYVYIVLWASWCQSCLAELELLPEMVKKYGKEISFVCISLDEDAEEMQTYLEAHPDFDWTFLHYEGKEELLQDYQVRALPAYYLVDREGKMFQSPARRPSPDGTNRSIDETFHNIYMTANPVKGHGVGNKNN